MTQSVASNIREMLLLCCSSPRTNHLILLVFQVSLRETCTWSSPDENMLGLHTCTKEGKTSDWTHYVVSSGGRAGDVNCWTVIRYVEKFTEHPSLNNQLQSSTEPATVIGLFGLSEQSCKEDYTYNNRLMEHLQRPAAHTQSALMPQCCPGAHPTTSTSSCSVTSGDSAEPWMFSDDISLYYNYRKKLPGLF